jgi:hypothetical protein
MSLKNKSHLRSIKLEREAGIERCEYCNKPYKLTKSGIHTKKFEIHISTCKMKPIESNITIICDICWDEILYDRDTCNSICGHIFHKECFENYDEDKCPMCLRFIEINE